MYKSTSRYFKIKGKVGLVGTFSEHFVLRNIVATAPAAAAVSPVSDICVAAAAQLPRLFLSPVIEGGSMLDARAAN